MTTPTTTPETEGVPSFLSRKDNGLQPVNAAAKIAAKHNAAATPKAEKPAKTAKAPKAKPTHKPSDIVRTEQNPAKSIVPVRFKQAYAEHGGTCGDKVALAVTAAITTKNDDGRTVLSDKLMVELGAANGIDMAKYAGLNMGQRSMNLRNRLRGLLKAGKSVKIGKQTFANAEKALAKPAAGEQATA